MSVRVRWIDSSPWNAAFARGFACSCEGDQLIPVSRIDMLEVFCNVFGAERHVDFIFQFAGIAIKQDIVGCVRKNSVTVRKSSLPSDYCLILLLAEYAIHYNFQVMRHCRIAMQV